MRRGTSNDTENAFFYCIGAPLMLIPAILARLIVGCLFSRWKFTFSDARRYILKSISEFMYGIIVLSDFGRVIYWILFTVLSLHTAWVYENSLFPWVVVFITAIHFYDTDWNRVFQIIPQCGVDFAHEYMMFLLLRPVCYYLVYMKAIQYLPTYYITFTLI